TAHKAQGRTLPDALIDLTATRGSESPYVMVSRVKTLEGLHILRPFSISRIQCNSSQDYRAEASRLKVLQLKTLM
ncbi:hypothetical protein BDZ89DRAFT_893949, partial [Hymenopellis radicata]